MYDEGDVRKGREERTKVAEGIRALPRFKETKVEGIRALPRFKETKVPEGGTSENLGSEIQRNLGSGTSSTSEIQRKPRFGYVLDVRDSKKT